MSDLPVFTITRLFAVDRDTMYDAWADPRKMVQWSGPKGSTVEILSGEVREGHTVHSKTVSPDMPPMYTLAKWITLSRPDRVVWEQSFADEQGKKTVPDFFDAWPETLLTEVDFTEEDGGTRVTLSWMPIEASPEALAEFEKQMAGMKGGWGGSFDELEAFLAG